MCFSCLLTKCFRFWRHKQMIKFLLAFCHSSCSTNFMNLQDFHLKLDKSYLLTSFVFHSLSFLRVLLLMLLQKQLWYLLLWDTIKHYLQYQLLLSLWSSLTTNLALVQETYTKFDQSMQLITSAFLQFIS